MSLGRAQGGGTESGGGGHYDMSLDDVRNYLIQSGSLQEAEKLLSLPGQHTPQQSQAQGGPVRQEEPTIKITEIKERILREREIEKEKVMRNLLTKHHRGVAELQQEDEEMRKLQIMETKLRDENIQIELMKQKLAEEMKQSKRSQLDDMAAITRRELEQLEQKRLEMERNMEMKRLEIEELQGELRKADEVILESSQPRERSLPAGESSLDPPIPPILTFLISSLRGWLLTRYLRQGYEPTDRAAHEETPRVQSVRALRLA
jgi:hypothetical protein